jgi:hypothetical protein
LASNEVVEVIWARGHENIQAAHPTTLMITKDTHLSAAGDCIVALAADKAAADLSRAFKDALRRPNAQLRILLEADGVKEQITASGSPNLQLTHTCDLVVRKSRFICNRTLAVQSDKASSSLSRELIAKLRNPTQKVKITLTVAAGQDCVGEHVIIGYYPGGGCKTKQPSHR